MTIFFRYSIYCSAGKSRVHVRMEEGDFGDRKENENLNTSHQSDRIERAKRHNDKILGTNGSFVVGFRWFFFFSENLISFFLSFVFLFFVATFEEILARELEKEQQNDRPKESNGEEDEEIDPYEDAVSSSSETEKSNVDKHGSDESHQGTKKPFLRKGSRGWWMENPDAKERTTKHFLSSKEIPSEESKRESGKRILMRETTSPMRTSMASASFNTPVSLMTAVPANHNADLLRMSGVRHSYEAKLEREAEELAAFEALERELAAEKEAFMQEQVSDERKGTTYYQQAYLDEKHGMDAIESHFFPQYRHFSFDDEAKDQGFTIQKVPQDNVQDQMEMEEYEDARSELSAIRFDDSLPWEQDDRTPKGTYPSTGNNVSGSNHTHPMGTNSALINPDHQDLGEPSLNSSQELLWSGKGVARAFEDEDHVQSSLVHFDDYDPVDGVQPRHVGSNSYSPTDAPVSSLVQQLFQKNGGEEVYDEVHGDSKPRDTPNADEKSRRDSLNTLKQKLQTSSSHVAVQPSEKSSEPKMKVLKRSTSTPSGNSEKKQQPSRIPRVTPTKVNSDDKKSGSGPVLPTVIEEKLMELEKEIEFYQKEKQNMKKQSQQLTKQYETFEKEKQNFENFKIEQMKLLEELKKDNQKHFKNLKRNLENKFLRSTKKKDEEKKQIEFLKAQISQMQVVEDKKLSKLKKENEILKQKIDLLTSQNQEMKEEISFLQKQNLQFKTFEIEEVFDPKTDKKRSLASQQKSHHSEDTSLARGGLDLQDLDGIAKQVEELQLQLNSRATSSVSTTSKKANANSGAFVALLT